MSGCAEAKRLFKGELSSPTATLPAPPPAVVLPPLSTTATSKPLSFHYRAAQPPLALTAAKLEVLDGVVGLMCDEMTVHYMADELAADARHYVPQDKALAKDLCLYIESYPMEKSEIIAKYITDRLLSQERALSGVTRYWLDENKWRALLAMEDQRDNLAVVLLEIQNLDLDFRECMRCVDDHSLSTRASFLVKLWRKEIVLGMDAFLAYREPGDLLKSHFHRVAWFHKFHAVFVDLLNHVRFKPGSTGEQAARSEFEAASRQGRAASRRA